ncbi:MAG: zinc-ribbon domain-containing protein [Clostridia bacterium]|nr:zinc-ribbon domain-containing protein [Clostridia bacterium]MBR3954182.1 zinc-ribbon domain-containing protein [Clostridia bacterium]
MNFCPNCGAALQAGENFCSACGTPVQQAPANQYAQPQENYNPYPEANQAPVENKKSPVPVVLGVLGIVFAWLFALIGHVLSIVGIVLGVKEYKANKNIAALVLPIIGEVCAVVSSVIGIISTWQMMGII